MNRILNLQGLASISKDMDDGGGSTSSNHACGCSTSSAVACFMGDDLVAI
ncbi:MAG TPA: hypothetical protein VF616_25340 [Duganella sp.]